MAQSKHARFVARYGQPRTVPPDVAVGHLGIRDRVHPRDVSALLLPDRDALERFDALTHDAQPLLASGPFPDPTGDWPDAVVAVYDLRPILQRSTNPTERDGIRMRDL
jgi:hypothetical protein